MTSIRVEPEHVSDLARAIAAAQAALSAQLSELQSAADLLASSGAATHNRPSWRGTAPGAPGYKS
ncbi:hypothetical protein [uncultured Microbacterium sp.]|uniref:hypothetical protein n=1 Tax=uncultured Microbacterium sp. TaxID=191216 RepID=UPI0025E18F8D|nr:hypothetical protein [uncultured Microbacterium sp.]